MALKKNSKNQEPIRPLFLLPEPHQKITRFTLKFNSDAYNKNLGKKMIHAENDAEAISSFLNEYKDSPETFKSYAKEAERLLLWCLHIGKTTISGIRKDDLNLYVDFLKSPPLKNFGVGQLPVDSKKMAASMKIGDLLFKHLAIIPFKKYCVFWILFLVILFKRTT